MEDLQYFKVDKEKGHEQVTLDMTQDFMAGPSTGPKILMEGMKGRLAYRLVKNIIRWSRVPDFTELMEVARYLVKEDNEFWSEAYEESLASTTEREEVEKQFMNNPETLADRLTRKTAMIGDETFRPGDRVFHEAVKRNREVLKAFVVEHGDENQVERDASELLPWHEFRELATKHLFSPMDDRGAHRMERLQNHEVCGGHGGRSELDPNIEYCVCSYSTDEILSLEADEWTCYKEIKELLPDATFELRAHLATCECRKNKPVIRRGVQVTQRLGSTHFMIWYDFSPLDLFFPESSRQS
jgi:hypothetical protein